MPATVTLRSNNCVVKPTFNPHDLTTPALPSWKTKPSLCRYLPCTRPTYRFQHVYLPVYLSQENIYQLTKPKHVSTQICDIPFHTIVLHPKNKRINKYINSNVP